MTVLSDSDLGISLKNILEGNSITAKHSISIEVTFGVVILKGRVYTYYLKQMIQEVIFREISRLSLETRPALKNFIEVHR